MSCPVGTLFSDHPAVIFHRAPLFSPQHLTIFSESLSALGINRSHPLSRWQVVCVHAHVCVCACVHACPRCLSGRKTRPGTNRYCVELNNQLTERFRPVVKPPTISGYTSTSPKISPGTRHWGSFLVPKGAPHFPLPPGLCANCPLPSLLALCPISYRRLLLFQPRAPATVESPPTPPNLPQARARTAFYRKCLSSQYFHSYQIVSSWREASGVYLIDILNENI